MVFMDKREKVAFLCDYKSYYGGNFIPSLLALEDGLKQRKKECVYIFPEDAKERYWIQYLKQTGRTVIFFKSNLSRKKFLQQLDFIVRENNVEILHVHFGNVLNAELYSFINKKVKVYIHLHSDFTAGEKTIREQITNMVIYHLLSKNVQFISVSKSFLKYNNKKTTWIPNGLATNRIPCEHKTGMELRRELGLAESDVLCEIFGWSPVIKGVDIAVRAIKQLNEQRKQKIYLAIVCGREYTAEKMKKYISDFTDLKGNESYLIYLPPIEDVFSYHEASDVLISSSRSEGFPYSILEMLSLGKYCVVSKIPGTLWAEKYSTVYSFKKDNIEGCKNAILNAIKDNKTNNIEIKKMIQDEYSIDRWVDSVIRCYQL